MRYIMILLSLRMVMSSYAQSSVEIDNKVRALWGDLYKDVKYRDERISYQAQIFIGGCNYEVLINDIRIDRHYGPSNGASSGSFPINTAILRTGEQTWKIRVFPIYDKSIVDDELIMTPRPLIEEGARVELSIEGVRFKVGGGLNVIDKDVLNFKAPVVRSEKNGNNILADAGKPYMEYSGTFKAKVPYTLKGWSESVDLSKENLDKLTIEVEEIYTKYRSWIQNGELDKLAKAKLKAEKEEAQVLFFTKELSDDYVNSFIKMWYKEGIEMRLIQKYQLKFYGNGRIIALEQKDLVGYPSLMGTFDEKGRSKARSYYIYFHRPSPGAPLEVIR